MTPKSRSVTCRLYCILAREAPVGVIFHRGPSKWVHVIKWNTDTDTFEAGQWFHGRIYERRCDLSPDGKHLIYFAQKINRATVGSDHSYAWTAISRMPYLTALALWPNGSCWAGGGLFTTDNTIWLNHREGATQAHPEHQPPSRLKIDATNGGYGEDGPILEQRLSRDGWRLTQDLEYEFRYEFKTISPRIHRKQNPSGWQKLSMFTTITGFTSTDAYSVRYGEGLDHDLNGAEWADWDQAGRLVFARHGKLFYIEFGGEQIEEHEIADFNQNKPEPMEAPDWAKDW